MHPVVTIVCFFVYAAGVASAAPGAVLLGLALLGTVLVALRERLDLHALGRALGRMRWLLAALLASYGWFTPGAPLLAVLGAASPSAEGVRLALWRSLALLQLFAGASIILALCSRATLVAALHALLAPFGTGLRERLAVRLALTLDAVPRLREAVAAARPPRASGTRFERLAAAAVGAYRAARVGAERAACLEVEFVPLPPVPRRAWGWPVGLAAAFALASRWAG